MKIKCKKNGPWNLGLIWSIERPIFSCKACRKGPDSMYDKKGKKSSNMENFSKLWFGFQNHDQCVDFFHVYSPFHSSTNIQANHKLRTKIHYLERALKILKICPKLWNSKTSFQLLSLKTSDSLILLRPLVSDCDTVGENWLFWNAGSRFAFVFVKCRGEQESPPSFILSNKERTKAQKNSFLRYFSGSGGRL